MIFFVKFDFFERDFMLENEIKYTNLREKIIKEKKEKNLIPFLESDSYKEAMQYKEIFLSQDEQQKIINEVNKEMNMSYENN